MFLAAGANPKARDENGRDVLGDAAIVAVLLDAGAGIEKRTTAGRSNRLLLSKGANARPRDTFGKLPIDYARENNHDDIVKLLEKAR